jgi:hypothetical protein
MVSVLVRDGAGIRLHAANIHERVRARWHAHDSDRAFVAGVSPDDSVVLALHARRILRPRSRAALAGTLRRIVRSAQNGPAGRVAAAPISRPQVRGAVGELVELADRLDRAGPIGPQSVAMARVVLSEGSGPLFRHGGDQSLRQCLQHALRLADSLEPVEGSRALSAG